MDNREISLQMIPLSDEVMDQKLKIKVVRQFYLKRYSDMSQCTEHMDFS